MNRSFGTLIAAALLCPLAVLAGRQDNVAERVFEQYTNGRAFYEAAPLVADAAAGKRKIEDVGRAHWLTIDRTRLVDLKTDAPDTLRFTLPVGDETLVLDLVRAFVVTDTFKVTTSEGREVPYTDGLHYRGIINGQEDALAALSIFDHEVMAVISIPDQGEMVLGKMPFEDGDTHILYSTLDMARPMDFTCETEEPDTYYQEVAKLLSAQDKTGIANDCVEVYFECDYAMYQEKGSVNNTVSFVTGMYNVVATIYQNESINTVIDQVYVWTQADGYSTSSSSSALNQFTGRSHNADLAHLLARGASGLGGVAWLNGLCNSYGYAYSNINSSYSNLPTYSWTVGVVAHEMGHNLGSPHTHSCSWSGGALDNCYTPEGSCSPGPAPPSSGGTIMSYCHLTSYGINLNSGFGYQPGNLIRNAVSNASCTQSCFSNPGCTGTTYVGSLTSGNQEFQPNGNYYYAAAGTHKGNLTGPSGADFDLYLWRWNGSQWTTVASGTTASADESVTYNGTAGYYVWRVHAYSGSGGYALCLDTP